MIAAFALLMEMKRVEKCNYTRQCDEYMNYLSLVALTRYTSCLLLHLISSKFEYLSDSIRLEDNHFYRSALMPVHRRRR
jgi:hypothetical protein